MSSAIHRPTIFRVSSSVKRTAASGRFLFLLAISFFIGEGASAVTPGASIHEESLHSFTEESYRTAVENLFLAFEEEQKKVLEPGEKGKVGLKISTISGPGLSTPQPLVRAVISSLVSRGFDRRDLFLIDLNEHRLRRSGFLPPLGVGEREFEGHPVYVLESGDFYDPIWFYDSPLPPRRGSVDIEYNFGEFRFERSEESRRSYLPVPLMLEVDFWINLPTYTDHPALGVNGALVNATLWNASNTSRFAHSERSGAAAVAEMAAIPELEEKWLFSIVSLERFQVAGGPAFRSYYTDSQPAILLSADPVALDSRMYRKINEGRERRGLSKLTNGGNLLEYANQLNLGEIEEEKE